MWERYVNDINVILAERASGSAPIDVLEAGCGSGSLLKFPSNARIVGIDISAQQLDRNTLLHERMIGDLQTHRYQPNSFDVVVCWDVLEHLSNPRAALTGFVTALRPGGLLILGVPNRNSLKGKLTRLLPLWMHVALYRRLLGSKTAGTLDHGPFPTPMLPDMSRRNIIDRLSSSGFGVLVDVAYESPMMVIVRRRLGLVGRRWAFVQRLVDMGTRGHVDVETTDCILVFAKNACPTNLG